jgi:hypothetical protein
LIQRGVDLQLETPQLFNSPTSQQGIVVSFRTFYRKKLNNYLETADDEGLMQLLWAANALQSDAEQAAAPYLDYRYPKTAVTTDLTQPSFIYKWELETLANEALATPKRTHRRRGGTRTLNTRSYNAVVNMANVLGKLENAEDVQGLKERSVLREMARIANRQFDWQRGYLNLPQFYRNAFVYGQGACADYFKAQHSITINQLSLVGFCMHTMLAENPVFRRRTDLSAVDVDSDVLERALVLIAKPISAMRALAAEERRKGYFTAYRPSVLRRFPCIMFGDENDRVRAPLPQLILERVTSGVFYDVVGGGGAVRHDYGRRFEEYCIKYLRAMLPTLNWREEVKYRARGSEMSTSDILLVEGVELGLAIECKATRMAYRAKFGDGDLDGGFEEIIKGVFQLWRFFSHCRRGLTGLTINKDAVGAVLTLDNWLQMANPLQDEVLSAASEMAAAKDPEIVEEDKRPITFFGITSMESTLATATSKSFLQAVRAAATAEFRGRLLSNVHERFTKKDQPTKPYPFRSDMGSVLPWWDAVPTKIAKVAATGTRG